jgi:hypothetical protein
MKKKIIYLITLISVSLFSGCRENTVYKNENGSGGCFYVSPSGNDKNPGTISQPWKTIAKINILKLNPGDTVLFEGGATFTGTIILDSLDSGEKEKIIVIGSYGNGRAVINGGNSEGIIVNNSKYFIIKDLTIIGSGRKEGNIADGIKIAMSENFELDSLEISGFQHSGLLVHICTNAKITNVLAHDNGFAGIHVTGTTMNDKVKYDNKNIYIGYCVEENNPGDPSVTSNHSGNGILVSSVSNGVIEYCEAFNNGWDMPWKGNGPVGIWIWDCTNFTIQYSIAHDNKTSPGGGDGGGFDLDGGVSNSVIQYCLSYNNQGAGYGLFEFGAAKVWENNTVRYNISQNDGSINGGALAIWRNESSGTIRNCDIYNNTFYKTNGQGNLFWIFNNWPGFKFRNNIFVYSGSFLFPEQKLVSELFQYNCYWNTNGDQRIAGYKNLEEWAGTTGNETINNRVVGMFINPGMLNPGQCSLTDPRKLNIENLSAFSLGKGSPLIDRGIDLKKMFGIEPGAKDITGTTLPQGKGFDIGAVEFINE